MANMAPLRREILATASTINPNEPSGEWSVFDLANTIGYPAHDVWEMTEKLREAQLISARYVGGTSVYLYS